MSAPSLHVPNQLKDRVEAISDPEEQYRARLMVHVYTAMGISKICGLGDVTPFKKFHMNKVNV